MTNNKLRWKGTFNWYGEVHEFWTHSSSKAGAYRNLIKQLAAKVGFKPTYVSNRYSGGYTDYQIVHVPKKD